MGSATTQLGLIPDHADRAATRLLTTWQEKARIKALIRSLATGTQELEHQQFSLIVSTGPDVATGDALDQWGEVVGEERGPLGDNEYRRFVQARMMANRCRGTIDELIAIFKIVTGSTVVRYETSYPAGFYLEAELRAFLPAATARRVRRIMDDAKPGGVDMTLIQYLPGAYGWFDDPEALGLDDGPFASLIA